MSSPCLDQPCRPLAQVLRTRRELKVRSARIEARTEEAILALEGLGQDEKLEVWQTVMRYMMESRD